jgi:RPM1-interacting protein 4
MNPNDPEENPEAFMSVRESPAVNVDSNNSISSSAKQQIKGHSRPPAHPRNIVTTSNQQKSGSHRSITSSESGSERSGSDYSLMQPGHRRVRSDMKKKKTSSDHGNKSFSNTTSVTRHATERTGSYSSNDHHTAVSLPFQNPTYCLRELK